MQTALILLAAGSSSRLRQPKQALPYKGTTLLQHSVEAALGSSADPVVVVTGAEQALALPMHPRLRVVHNSEWQEGMASSIRTGLKAALHGKEGLDRIILMVCDQPFVSAGLLHVLEGLADKTGTPIAACAYGDTLGTPVLFHKQFFHELAALSGDEGAKKIVLRYREQVAVVPFEEGTIDIDTRQDYETLLQRDA